ncbi:hypothetical protein GWG65_19940 [Bradyrhizobium sp. CSA207]|uniref:hypothetical protein n=1 Tax=Bradyrhizobium sp. CSA207 TaxID=2698826 RepID=UPI0023AEE774|nr:hypothetical protein [Bradyrhizobium sp. CSA207]MDE5443675.1 hypothetical protein [Bradyrhizobium sp. CSA207]
MLLVIDRGFDLTDEGMYLYDMEHPGLNSGTHINLIAGKFGHLFHNNIVVWRAISLALNIAGSLIFAAGFWRLGACLGLLGDRTRSAQAGFSIAVLIGSLGYYGAGPPSLSSNSVAAFGLLAGTGMLALAVTVAPGIWRYFAVALSSLAIVLLEAARISAGLGYVLAAPAMLWLASSLIGWRATVRLALAHILFGVLWTIVLATSLDAWQQILPVVQFLLSTGASGESSYNYSLLAEQHLQDILAFAWQSLRYAAAAAGAGLVSSLLLLGWRSFFASPSFLLLRRVRASVLFFAALLPMIPLSGYISLIDVFANWPTGACAGAGMIVCDQPTGLTGRPFMYAVGGQIVVAALFIALDRLSPRSAPRDEVVARWSISTFFLLLTLLLVLTIVTSIGTNTGLLAHSIFCLGPVMAAGYFALTHAGSRLGRIPDHIAPVSLVCFSLLMAIAVGHNRLFFPYRLDSTIFKQTTRLNHPPELKRLKVSANLSSVLTSIDHTLQGAGFDPQRDLVLPIYNMPGLLVGTNTRAFGFAWLDTGPGWDEINCHRVKTDPADLRAIGRLFVLSNSAASPAFANCLKERGVDMAAERRIATIPIEADRAVTVGIIPIP